VSFPVVRRRGAPRRTRRGPTHPGRRPRFAALGLAAGGIWNESPARVCEVGQPAARFRRGCVRHG
jgi:hypothetical protein